LPHGLVVRALANASGTLAALLDSAEQSRRARSRILRRFEAGGHVSETSGVRCRTARRVARRWGRRDEVGGYACRRRQRKVTCTAAEARKVTFRIR
jgi:hypothetical protein